MTKEKIDWSLLYEWDIENFACGRISGNELKRLYTGTNAGGMVRRMLAERGVDNARKIARCASYRRKSK